MVGCRVCSFCSDMLCHSSEIHRAQSTELWPMFVLQHGVCMAACAGRCRMTPSIERTRTTTLGKLFKRTSMATCAWCVLTVSSQPAHVMMHALSLAHPSQPMAPKLLGVPTHCTHCKGCHGFHGYKCATALVRQGGMSHPYPGCSPQGAHKMT